MQRLSLNWGWIYSRENKNCHPSYSQRGRWQRNDYSPLYFGLLSTLETISLISIQAISFSHKYKRSTNALSSLERRVISVFINRIRTTHSRCNNHPRPVDTWLYMMLVSIKSEHGGSLQLNSVSLMLVPWGYRYPMGTTRAPGERVQGLVPPATRGRSHVFIQVRLFGGGLF
jgi:hypothetical protein